MLGVKTCRGVRTCCAGRAHWRSAAQSVFVPGPARRYGMQGLACWLHAWRWRTWQCLVWPPTHAGALLWRHMHYRSMTVAFSIVTPIITSGLGPATQHGVNALNRSCCSIVRDDHTLRICSRYFFVKKNVKTNICHCLTKSQFLTFSLPEKFLIIILFEMISDSHNFENLGLQKGQSTFKRELLL